MRRIAAILLLLAGPVSAQTPGNINLVGPSTSRGAPQVTPEAINTAVNAALALKADVTFIGAQQIAQPVSNAAYGAGNAVGGLMTFNASARLPSSTGSMQSMTIALPDAQIPTLDVLIFSSPPISSTIADRTAVSISLTDQVSQIGVLHVSDCTGTQTVCQSQQAPLPFALATHQTTLYAVIIARNAFTPSNLPIGAPAWLVTMFTQQN